MSTDGVTVRGRLRRRLLFVVVVGGAACQLAETTVPTPTAELLVHAVLNPAIREQVILVERVQTGTIKLPSVPENDTAATRGGIPEPGATVEILTPNGLTLRAVEAISDSTGRSSGVYRISLDRYGVSLSPGERYSLRVRTTLGEEVTGTTTIPLAPTTVPSLTPRVFNRDRDSLRLEWPRSVTTHYQLHVSSPYETGLTKFADTAVVLTGDARANGINLFVPGFRATAAIFAVDSNYYDYYRSSNNPFTGTGLISRLVGGIGVFGSVVVVATQTIEVRADSNDTRDGLYRLVSKDPPPSAATEIYLYVTPNQFSPYIDVTGNYATSGSSGRDQGLAGWSSGTGVYLSLMADQTMRKRVASFTGEWSGATIVGHFEGSTATVVYARE